MPGLQLLQGGACNGASRKLAALVETANRDPSITRIMTGWDRQVALAIEWRPFAIVTSGGRAVLVDGAVSGATPFFTLSEHTLELLMERRVTPLAAKLKGLIRSSGSLADILRFASLLSASVQRMEVTP